MTTKSNTEIKAYFAVIKATAKKAKMPGIGGRVAIWPGTIQATNLESMVTVFHEHGVAEKAIYEADAIELIAQGLTDISAYRADDIDYWPGFMDKADPITTIELTPDLIGHLRVAADCASKDTSRPALTGVCIKDRQIFGTDGYIAHASRPLIDWTGEVLIPAEVIKMILKLIKYGDWRLEIFDTYVLATNGTIIIKSKRLDCQYPDVRSLCERAKLADKIVSIPLKQLKSLLTKVDHIEIDQDGKIFADGRQLPIAAAVSDDQYIFGIEQSHTLICGMANSTKWISLNPALLGRVPATKAGEVRLRVGEGQMIYSVV